MIRSTSPTVEVRGLSVRYGGFYALRDLSTILPAGKIIGVIGPNGAGKTTLLNAISGFTHVTQGEILLDGQEIQIWDIRQRVRAGLVRSFQTVRLMERESVLTNVLIGAEPLEQPNSLSQLLALPAQRRSQRRDQQMAYEVIELLGLGLDLNRLVDELPFASRRLVEVARVLISYPPVILLDEPAAGLDQEGRHELAAVLARVHEHHPSTLVIVEHDVDLVKSLCSHVVALESGAVVCEGSPDQVFGDPRVQLAYFGRVADASA